MMSLANSFARCPFGIGVAMGLMLCIPLEPIAVARTAGAVCGVSANLVTPAPLHNDMPSAAVQADDDDDPTAAVWAAGWGLAYDEEYNGMSMDLIQDSDWTVTLHDSNNPDVGIGTGTYVETIRVEPDILVVDPEEAQQQGLVSARAYYSAGVLTAPNDWSTPLSMFVVEVESDAPVDGHTVVTHAIALRADAPTIGEAESELLAFTEHAFGGGVQRGSASHAGGCIGECQDGLDRDLLNARLDRDNAVGNCKDTFLGNAVGCATGSALCGIWYGLCVGGCLSGFAIMYKRCVNRADDDYSRDVDDAYADYNACLANCQVGGTGV